MDKINYWWKIESFIIPDDVRPLLGHTSHYWTVGTWELNPIVIFPQRVLTGPTLTYCYMTCRVASPTTGKYSCQCPASLSLLVTDLLVQVWLETAVWLSLACKDDDVVALCIPIVVVLWWWYQTPPTSAQLAATAALHITVCNDFNLLSEQTLSKIFCNDTFEIAATILILGTKNGQLIRNILCSAWKHF